MNKMTWKEAEETARAILGSRADDSLIERLAWFLFFGEVKP